MVATAETHRINIRSSVSTAIADGFRVMWSRTAENPYLAQEPGTASTIQIVSTSSDDSSTGQGASHVTIAGVIQNADGDSVYHHEEIAMGGLVPASSVSQYESVQSMWVSKSGRTLSVTSGAASATGTITANVTAPTPLTGFYVAEIPAGNRYADGMWYHVPPGYRGRICDITAINNSTSGFDALIELEPAISTGPQQLLFLTRGKFSMRSQQDTFVLEKKAPTGLAFIGNIWAYPGQSLCILRSGSGVTVSMNVELERWNEPQTTIGEGRDPKLPDPPGGPPPNQ